MSILISSNYFALFIVFWPVYEIQTDSVRQRCFRVRLGSRHFGWPKRK